MAKILIIYALNEYPTRNTIRELLSSFKKYSAHKICYYNLFSNKLPDYLKKADFNAVIFHQTITLCGNKKKYQEMIENLRKFLFGMDAVKIALFQDEYFYTDMSVAFINELKLDYIFSVAPREEWMKIYKGIRAECVICPMLTGYISLKSKRYYESAMSKNRTVDIGYRVVWDKPSIVLGRFGYDKLRIARLFLKQMDKNRFCMDIKTGSRHLIKGKKWNHFLSSCRFVLGVESGSGVLDSDGSIRENVFRAIEKNPGITARELYKKFVEKQDGQYGLKAISPRHFEAIEEGACQILYEGEYSGILKPYIHYIPLKKDHSNYAQVMDYVKDEQKRREIVKRAFQDIVASGNYTYEKFVHEFFDKVLKNSKSVRNKLSLRERMIFCRVRHHEARICFFLMVITFLKRKGMLAWMQKNSITRSAIRVYYAFRH